MGNNYEKTPLASDESNKSKASIKQEVSTTTKKHEVNTISNYDQNSKNLNDGSRPSVCSRQSFAQSVSSVSLYSHFAGERFEHKNKENDDEEKTLKTKKDIPVLLSNNKSSKTLKKNSDSIDDDTCSTFSSDDKEISKVEEVSGHDRNTPKSSVGKAMFMFLKAFIGSGVLFLPKAFQHGGIVLSPILLIVVACICQFAFIRLVETQKIIGGSFGDVGGVLFGKTVRYIVLFFIVISQLGFICSYLVFVSGNLVNVVDVLTHCASTIAQKYYIWIVFAVTIPLVLVRHIAKLSFAAVIADVFILFGLLSCLYFTAQELHVSGMGPDIKPVNNAFALMISTATFSFEGVGLILPIGESMKNPEKFPFVITIGMIIVCFVYILIGSISYIAYGNRIQAAVLYNFPRDNPLTLTVQILYSIAIILSIPLVLFPVTNILEPRVFRNYHSGRNDIRIKWSKNIFRTILLGLCGVVAFSVGGENLDIFVSFVGCIACVPLCFIFPGLFHYKIAKTLKDKIFDAALCLFGVILTIYTLYVTTETFMFPQNDSILLSPYCLK